MWLPQPDLKRAAAAWIYAGGAHHTSFSYSVNQDYLRDFAEMAGIEYVAIDSNTDLHRFKQELKWNDLYYHLAKGI
jgi:L-arabinose isomerase